jgi:hypothetical protein
MYFKRGGAHECQGSSGHYCSPKNDTGPYTSWSRCWSCRRAQGAEELRQAAANTDRKDKSRLFTWVPVDAVNAEIERRGGIA